MERIAFDASQGRLWVVCRRCAKWNLVPFDTRLESIDACERLYRDTATRYSTGSIGLARTKEGLDLVRIGAALRPEFASWRYGESYRRRRRLAIVGGGLGVVAVGGLMAAIGASAGIGVMLGGMGWSFVEAGWRAGLRLKTSFRLTDPDNPRQRGWVAWDQLKGARLTWQEERMALDLPRPIGGVKAHIPMRFEGSEVFTVGRRVIGGLNVLAGTERHIAQATALLGEHNGDLAPWLRRRVSARERGIGVAVSNSTSGASPLFISAERCSTPKRCCSSITTSPRWANSTCFCTSA